MITNTANPLSNLSEETVQGIFTGAIRDWSEVPGRRRSRARSTCSTATAPPVRRTPSSTSSSAKNRKSPRARRAETSNGLEQNAVSSDKQAIGFVSFAYTARRERGRLRGHRLQPAQRQVRAVRAACVTSGWSPKARRKAKRSKFITWVTSGNKIDDSDHQLELDRNPLSSGARRRIPPHAATRARRQDRPARRAHARRARGRRAAR